MATNEFGLTWLGKGGQQVQCCRETYSRAVETLVCNSGEPSSATSFSTYLDDTNNSLLLEGKIQKERLVMVGQFSVTGIEVEIAFLLPPLSFNFFLFERRFISFFASTIYVCTSHMCRTGTRT